MTTNITSLHYSKVDQKNYFQVFCQKNRSFFCSLLFIALLTFSSVLPNQTSNEQPQEQEAHITLEPTVKISSARLQSIMIGIYFLGMAYLYGNDATKEALKNQLEPNNLAKNVLYEYSTQLSSTFIHEYGHALAEKILFNNPSTIELNLLKPVAGKTISPHFSADQRKILSTLLSKSIAQQIAIYAQKHALDHKTLLVDNALLTKVVEEIPLSEDVLATIEAMQETNRYKEIIASLAGGSFGIIGHIVLKTIINKVTQANSLTSACKQALRFDHVILNHLCNMLLPFNGKNLEAQDQPHVIVENEELMLQILDHGGSDGLKVWSKLHVPQAIIKTVNDYGKALTSFCYLALTMSESSPEAKFPEKLMTAYANYFLEGYLHVKI